MTFNEIKEINEKKLNYYQNIEKQNLNQENLKIKIEIHIRIKKLLEENEALFFQISMEESLAILSQLFPEEDLKKVYANLISQTNYVDLKKRLKL